MVECVSGNASRAGASQAATRITLYVYSLFVTLLCSSAFFPSSPVQNFAGQPMVGQNEPKFLSKRRLFHRLRFESFQLGFRRNILGLDSLITDYRPKICAVTNAIKGMDTGAVVVKTQLYGIEWITELSKTTNAVRHISFRRH